MSAAALPGQDATLARGQAALASGNWTAARDAFSAAVRAQSSPEAHDGLGLALWWLNDIPTAHEHRHRAYQAFLHRGDRLRASMLAAWLAREHVFFAGNVNAMNGWFARAERLLASEQPGAEHGWVRLYRASMLASPAELATITVDVLDLAGRSGDTDLELFALAYQGLAEVSLGHVAQGLDQLDEAMALATSGGAIGLATISEIFCVTLTACELSGDLMRSDQWCRAATAFAERYHCSFLAAYCRTTYGGVLTALGHWSEAGQALLGAVGTFEAGHRALRVHAVIKLADLRVQQGRLEEAALLLDGLEDQAAAALPLARLHLARGEIAWARAVLEQMLPASALPNLDRAPHLLLLVDVLVAAGNAAGARTVVDRLRELATRTGSDLWLAEAELAGGRVAWLTGQANAELYIRAAWDRLKQFEQSLAAGRARLAMAQCLADRDRAGAVTWARAALASFTRLGATHEADQAAALLRQLGVQSRVGARQGGDLTAREREVLDLLTAGLANGEIATRLVISPKTAEHHVSQILAKLGVRSRAEAAALAAAGRVAGHAAPAYVPSKHQGEQ